MGPVSRKQRLVHRASNKGSETELRERESRKRTEYRVQRSEVRRDWQDD